MISPVDLRTSPKAILLTGLLVLANVVALGGAALGTVLDLWEWLGPDLTAELLVAGLGVLATTLLIKKFFEQYSDGALGAACWPFREISAESDLGLL
jgi:hypothetical protein